jgi:hypothetical protein
VGGATAYAAVLRPVGSWSERNRRQPSRWLHPRRGLGRLSEVLLRPIRLGLSRRLIPLAERDSKQHRQDEDDNDQRHNEQTAPPRRIGIDIAGHDIGPRTSRTLRPVKTLSDGLLGHAHPRTTIELVHQMATVEDASPRLKRRTARPQDQATSVAVTSAPAAWASSWLAQSEKRDLKRPLPCASSTKQ